MRVKVNNSMSIQRAVNAGGPQGSVLGSYIFNIGVDDMEKGFVYQVGYVCCQCT